MYTISTSLNKFWRSFLWNDLGYSNSIRYVTLWIGLSIYLGLCMDFRHSNRQYDIHYIANPYNYGGWQRWNTNIWRSCCCCPHNCTSRIIFGRVICPNTLDMSIYVMDWKIACIWHWWSQYKCVCFLSKGTQATHFKLNMSILGPFICIRVNSWRIRGVFS